MVIFFNIDKFLEKKDLQICVQNNFTWPWAQTHFILLETCYGCKNKTEENLPLHFILAMTKEDVKILSAATFFWCQTCHFSVYDHFPSDECDHCNE